VVPVGPRPERASLPPLRSARILVRLRLRRALNRFASISFSRKRKGNTRSGTPGKASKGIYFGAFLAAIFLFSYAQLADQAMRNLQHVLGSSPEPPAGLIVGEHRNPEVRYPIAPEAGETFSDPVRRGAGMLLTLLFGASLLVSLANKEIAAPEWDMEWLVTLPIPLSMLLFVRIVERALLNFFAIFAIVPFVVVLALRSGLGWAALPCGLGVSFFLLVLLAILQTLVEVVLKLRLAPSKLRNIQAFLSIGGLVLLYLAMSLGLQTGHDADYFIYGWAQAFPSFALSLPTGLPVLAFSRAPSGGGLLPAGVLALECGLLAVAGVAYLARRLRRGVVSEGARESGRRTGKAPAGEVRRSARGFFTPIQSKELRLLGRDRNFLVQTLVLPVVIGGFQVLINPGILRGVASAPEHLGTFAFLITAYVLMFSAFQVLNAEGQALWILYTVPASLDRMVVEKALLWGGLACVYPLAILAAGVFHSGTLGLETLGVFVVVLVGIPIYAVIAACLGVLGSNPQEPEVQRRVRPQQAYLYMSIASSYVWGIYADGIAAKASLVVLTALLAFALWQKARDQLPYLLDPVAMPPPRVSLADGLIATLLFFVLQGLAAVACRQALEISDSATLTLAFGIAGAVTYLGARAIYARKRASGVPRVFGPEWKSAALVGLRWGFFAASAGVVYLYLIEAGWIPLSHGDSDAAPPQAMNPYWLYGIGVVLAPIFEEFIFRGLIFGGLRRSCGPWVSVLASAAIFAIVHPAGAMPPVFALGVCAALAQEKTGLLLAPMLTHAIYNAVVFALQSTPGL
jgi:membrane protease YdiL (CAAX protease family)